MRHAELVLTPMTAPAWELTPPFLGDLSEQAVSLAVLSGGLDPLARDSRNYGSPAENAEHGQGD